MTITLSRSDRREAARHLLESQADMLQEIKMLKEAISLAYGHLWHINTEMLAPVALYPPDQAASAARKSLLTVMTTTERANAIDAFRLAIKREDKGKRYE